MSNMFSEVKTIVKNDALSKSNIHHATRDFTDAFTYCCEMIFGFVLT